MFATSEFPLEIPRMQTRNFTYTKPLGAIKKQHRKMGELSEIAKELNLPKQLLDKGEKVIKAVFGPSISEISETFADNFRLRRFKNQVKILTKANEHITELGFDPKQIDF